MPAFRHVDLRRQAGDPRDPDPEYLRLYVDANGVPRVRYSDEDSALGGAPTASAVTLDPAVVGQSNVQDALAAVAGGLRLVDLGVVNAVDLLDGPVTLYTPVAGEWVQVGAIDDSFVAFDGTAHCTEVVSDNDTAAPLISINDTLFALGISPFAPGPLAPIVYGPTALGGASLAVHLALRPLTGPVRAFQAVGGTSPIEHLVSTPWTPGRVISAFTDYVTESGYIWQPEGFGTTGVSLPDFTDPDVSVVDNDITWDSGGKLPTQGSLHLYAMVGTL